MSHRLLSGHSDAEIHHFEAKTPQAALREAADFIEDGDWTVVALELCFTSVFHLVNDAGEGMGWLVTAVVDH